MLNKIAHHTGNMVRTRPMILRQLVSSSHELVVRDYPSEKVFKMKLENSDYGTVDYVKRGNVYELTHSEIPLQYQGQGLGRVLAKKTFDLISSKQNKMKITCEFLHKYYTENKSNYPNVIE